MATPKAEAAAGEYQFLFVIGDYLGESPVRAHALFGRRDWKHLYEIDSIATIRPFSLAEVVGAAGAEASAVEYRYKGQTQHHRIIRTILPEHEDLWRGRRVTRLPSPQLGPKRSRQQALDDGAK